MQEQVKGAVGSLPSLLGLYMYSERKALYNTLLGKNIVTGINPSAWSVTQFLFIATMAQKP